MLKRRDEGRRMIHAIAGTFGIGRTDLAEILHVRPSTLGQWSRRGVPAAHTADVDRLLELSERFRRAFANERIQQIVRTPGAGLNGRTVLEVLKTDGPQAVSDYLYRLLSFIVAR